METIKSSKLSVFDRGLRLRELPLAGAFRATANEAAQRFGSAHSCPVWEGSGKGWVARGLTFWGP